MRERGFNMKLGTKNSRSLLGIPDKNDNTAAKLAMQQDEELVQKQNDKTLDEIARKVGIIKKVSMDIEQGIGDGIKIADDVDNDMGGVQGLLSGTMQRLGNLASSGGSRHMCYLVVFIVFVFILVYFIITRTAKNM